MQVWSLALRTAPPKPPPSCPRLHTGPIKKGPTSLPRCQKGSSCQLRLCTRRNARRPWRSTSLSQLSAVMRIALTGGSAAMRILFLSIARYLVSVRSLTDRDSRAKFSKVFVRSRFAVALTKKGAARSSPPLIRSKGLRRLCSL